MKFSVLLPTRNRLKYLKYAVESVLRQDYESWEIIISDNDSQDNIFEYVKSLKDDRIKYFRTDHFISVTENWNNAMNQSSGDYVIMLGDDDILLDGYFSKILNLQHRFNDPDVIYANAYIYAYPGVIPSKPKGFLQSCSHYPIFDLKKEPFWLSRDKALHLVKCHGNFRAEYGTNMQYSLIKRSLIESIRVAGQFFHSPYPDVYAMNIMLLRSDKILINPDAMVVIGVTPKSTGNFLVNRDEKKAMEFLNISGEMNSSSLASMILPGSPSLSAWLISMEQVKENLKGECDFSVNWKRYRKLQIDYFLNQIFSGSIKDQKRGLLKFFTILKMSEKLFCFFPLFSFYVFKRFFPAPLKAIVNKFYAKFFACSNVPGDGTIKGEFSNVLQVFDKHKKGQLLAK